MLFMNRYYRYIHKGDFVFVPRVRYRIAIPFLRQCIIPFWYKGDPFRERRENIASAHVQRLTVSHAMILRRGIRLLGSEIFMAIGCPVHVRLLSTDRLREHLQRLDIGSYRIA